MHPGPRVGSARTGSRYDRGSLRDARRATGIAGRACTPAARPVHARLGAPMTVLIAFLRRRAPLAAACGLGALALHCARELPESRGVEDLAELLASATDTVVEPQSIAWEPTSGPVADLLVGRRVVFLAAPEKGQPKDVYRAWVRVSWDGAPL